MGGLPLNLRCEIQKDPPGETLKAEQSYQLETEIAGTRFALKGGLTFPLRERDIEEHFTISGPRLDRLEPLLKVALPAYGPYELSGIFRMGPEGYSFADIAATVGRSRLKGNLNIITSGPHPRLAVSIETAEIDVADFLTDASQGKAAQSAAASKEQPQPSGDETGRAQLYHLLDPRGEHGIDTELSIAAAEVRFDEKQLGSGSMHLRREENAWRISPLSVSVPGGNLNGALELLGKPDGISGAIKIEVRDLDYGPLARLKDPDSKSAGQVSLAIDLRSEAFAMEMLMAAANGRVALSMHPENIRAGVLDYWATNLLFALLPVLSPQNESKINCIIADLTINDGVMTEESMVIDTSQIRVGGKARIDWKTQTVNLRLIPKPKRPQFFSLATPMEVTGKFKDFDVGLAPGGLIRTAIRFLTSYIVVPIQWIILNKLPSDGRDVCSHAIIAENG